MQFKFNYTEYNFNFWLESQPIRKRLMKIDHIIPTGSYKITMTPIDNSLQYSFNVDSFGRRKSATLPDDVTSVHLYNDQSQLTEITSSESRLRYEYSDNGQLAAILFDNSVLAENVTFTYGRKGLFTLSCGRL